MDFTQRATDRGCRAHLDLSGVTLAVENPAKRQPIAIIPRGDAADVNGAVEAAACAFPGCRVAPRDRGRMLLRIATAWKRRRRA